MTPDDRYARCEALILSWEGGSRFTENPADPGRATKFGVTLATLQTWRGRPCTTTDVEALTQDEAGAIYRKLYWAPILGDILPAGLDLMMFDCAVNMGVGRASHFLQEALGVAADGRLGPQTVQAIQSMADPSAAVESVRAARAEAYKTFSGYSTFGAGWMSRLTQCASIAMGWAAAG